MATQLDSELSKQIIAAIATASQEVRNLLPEVISTPLGTHDVWYALDDDGLYACVECWPLFEAHRLVSEYDDRDAFPMIGWRIDLDPDSRAILEARGCDIADHTVTQPF